MVSYLPRNQCRVHGPERVAQGQGDGTPTPQATLHSCEVGSIEKSNNAWVCKAGPYRTVSGKSSTTIKVDLGLKSRV